MSLMKSLLAGSALAVLSTGAALADPALIYDLGGKFDKSFNEASFNGAERFKAETGVGGTVVSEVVYRNELISIHSQQRLADQAWRANKCHESPPDTPAAAAPATPAPAARGPRAPRGVVH